MASTLDPMPWLRPWIFARAPALENKVFPHTAPKKGAPNSRTPYLLYSQVWFERISAMNVAGTGVARAVYQLDVVAERDMTATEIADLITGTTESPGLHGFQGLMEREGHGSLFVQRAWLFRPGSAEEYDPEHAQGTGEFGVSRDYEIVFDEKLQAP